MSDTLRYTLAHTLNYEHVFLYRHLLQYMVTYTHIQMDDYTKRPTLIPDHKNAHTSTHMYRQTHHLEYPSQGLTHSHKRQVLHTYAQAYHYDFTLPEIPEVSYRGFRNPSSYKNLEV